MASTSRFSRVEIEEVAAVVPRSERVAGGLSHVRQRRAVAVPEQRKAIERELSDVNKSAEAFIQRFRKQLEIQRMESLENFENMLARGT